MDMTKTKNCTKGFLTLGWIALVVAVVCIISTVSMLLMAYASAGVPMDAGMLLMYLYQSGGLIVVLFVALLIALLLVKSKRELIAKIMTWGILLLSVLYIAPMFLQIPYFLQAQAAEVLMYILRYISVICMVVTLVAVLTQWDSSNKGKANGIALVASVVAIVAVVYYLIKMPRAVDILSLVVTITMSITHVLVCVVYWMITRSRRMFDRVVFAMTEEDAIIVESVEDRIEELSEEIEQEIMNEIAEADTSVEQAEAAKPAGEKEEK